ncbi:MAG TPA: metal-dependent transcriptional regulator [Roseiflexaceae bacterium]|nr:metal-dependent transcriptional regulator [Roseiflexaceae bacterium]
MQNKAVEDYLKTIYDLQREHGKVATTVLAERLALTPASVTGMIKKLAGMHLLEHEPYQGVVLTAAGEKIALEVIRHHRLIERYLAEALGVPWDKVHEEADKWEHVLSEEMEDRIDAMLGYPTTDPHGAPIPTRDGTMAPPVRERLSDLQPGQVATVAEVNDHDPAVLRYLGELGLYPGARVEVLAVAPFNGPLTVRLAGAEHALGREVAAFVSVSAIEPA